MEHMHYAEFRARVYAIIDRALDASKDCIVDSVHEDADDSIDQLLIDLIASIQPTTKEKHEH